MSTLVYQGGFQSCYESQIIETTTLKLKGPTIEFGREKCHSPINKVTNLDNMGGSGGWTFLQTLSNVNSKHEPTTTTTTTTSTYVHPALSSKQRLSEKSLELCTESLGSETGTDIMESCTIFPSNPNIEKTTTSHERQPQGMVFSNKKRNTTSSCKFPPPLTTMNSVQFRPQREGGRLIIKAVETPRARNYLQAERSNGRLRLCFYKSEISNFESLETTQEEIELQQVVDNEMLDDSDIRDDEEMEEEGEDEEEEEKESDILYVKCSRGMDGNSFDVEGEMGKEKCQRLMSRCKEGGQGNNKGFCDWRKPLWVATS